MDAALTLAQELLSAGQDVFPLTAVPDLPGLIGRLSPKATPQSPGCERAYDGLPLLQKVDVFEAMLLHGILSDTVTHNVPTSACEKVMGFSAAVNACAALLH